MQGIPPTLHDYRLRVDRSTCRGWLAVLIGPLGGMTTVARYGVALGRAIGTAGARVTVERHGIAYWRAITAAKG